MSIHNNQFKTICRLVIKPARIISILLMIEFLVFPMSLWAKVSSELPAGLCGNPYYQCDTKTEQNWHLFQSSTGIQDVNSNHIYIGRCSRNGNYNSNVYVLLALAEKSDKHFFNIKLSFNNDLSIYKDFEFSRISEIFPDTYNDRNLIIKSDAFAYIDFSKTGPFRYWLRYNPDENKMVVVAYFGYSDTYICDVNVREHNT